MTLHLKTTITAVGPDVADLAEGGVLILFADGAPPELAEVSVLHAPEVAPNDEPPVGTRVMIGNIESKITAVGPIAWNKVKEIGHVVINFNDADAVERPGEICAAFLDPDMLKASLKVGSVITIGQ
ncbi:PTS glucitol/sorbitol transporter subunit IIA [Rhizobium sp.]